MILPTDDELYRFHAGDCAALLAQLPDASVDLVFTSPPYEGQRTYEDGMPGGGKFRLRGQAWVDWLAPLIVECCRVSRGLALVNVSAPVKQYQYTAAVEWLVADLTRIYGVVCGPSPYCWQKGAGIPGKTRYHRRDWEPVYCFCLPDRLRGLWCDPLAFAQPPGQAPGGDMRPRKANGERNYEPREIDSDTAGRRPHGGRKSMRYKPPKLANPGNVIRAVTGGNVLGSRLAHRGEAPMPEKLAERFVAWYCPPGGIVLDPFLGTGTTAAVAIKHHRRAVGFDVRPSQIEIAQQRMREIQPALC